MYPRKRLSKYSGEKAKHTALSSERISTGTSLSTGNSVLTGTSCLYCSMEIIVSVNPLQLMPVLSSDTFPENASTSLQIQINTRPSLKNLAIGAAPA